MKKKGQVTIFIIIAIILVAAIALFFIFKDSFSSEEGLPPDIEEIYLFVEDCIEEVSADITYEIGLGGGYFFPPKLSTNSGITYYYSEGENYMPSKEQIEDEISYYLSERLFFCTKNFIDFPEFEITQGKIETKTEIKDEEIILDVNYPIRVTKGKQTTIIEDFEEIVEIRLGIVYSSVDEIIKDQLNHESICLSCIFETATNNDLYVDLLDYDEETVVFIVRDENSRINKEDFEFIFANKYQNE